MAWIVTTSGVLMRNPCSDLTKLSSSPPSFVGSAIEYLDGEARKHIENKMAQRFATTVEKRKNAITGVDESYIAVGKEAAAAAIKYGLLEVCSIYAYQRITRELASLFSYGATYEYSTPDWVGIDDLTAARDDAGRDSIMGRADWLAVGIGSSAVRVQVIGDHLDYQPIERDKIWIGFDDTITDDGVERPVDRTRIDDATFVVLALSGAGASGKRRYVAYFGRSEAMPQGRMVTYWSSEWSSVPDVDSDPDAIEYVDESGEIANPLTLYGNRAYKGAGSPEYPVAAWIGDTSNDTTDLLPVDDGLFQQAQELDLAASRILLSVLKSARGTFEFHKEADASSYLPPTIDEGIAMTEHGQTLATHSIPGSNSESAMRVLDMLVSNTAEAFGVPSYRVSMSGTAVIPSGAALAEMNRPLDLARQRRAMLNRKNMKRLFRLECALAGAESGLRVGEGITEAWTPNPERLASERLTELQEAQLEMQMGVADVSAIAERIYPELDSEEKLNNYLVSIGARESASAEVITGGGMMGAAQDAALNGAQIASMLAIAEKVAIGALTTDVAIALVMASIPGISEERARAMVGERSPDAAPAAPAPAADTAATQAATTARSRLRAGR